MAKKKKKEETKDPMGLLTKGIEAQIKLIRTDNMGKFQNEVVDLIGKTDLMAQEICFVLDIIKENVRNNFMRARALKEGKPKE